MTNGYNTDHEVEFLQGIGTWCEMKKDPLPILKGYRRTAVKRENWTIEGKRKINKNVVLGECDRLIKKYERYLTKQFHQLNPHFRWYCKGQYRNDGNKADDKNRHGFVVHPVYDSFEHGFSFPLQKALSPHSLTAS